MGKWLAHTQWKERWKNIYMHMQSRWVKVVKELVYNHFSVILLVKNHHLRDRQKWSFRMSEEDVKLSFREQT